MLKNNCIFVAVIINTLNKLIMGTINSQLDALFEKWSKVRMPFVYDGILYKRDNSINIEKEWLSSNRRVLFLLKDQNQFGKHENDDARRWILDSDKTANIKQRFIHKIANLVYGYSNITQNNPIPYESLNNEEVKACFNVIPFALMECKKQPGGSRVTDKVLSDCMENDKDFIVEEIEILNPNIIVCCGGVQFDFMINLFGKDNLIGYGYGNDLWKNLMYSRKHNLVILYAGHPSSRGKYSSYYDYYENNMHNFREFLNSEDGKRFLGE